MLAGARVSKRPPAWQASPALLLGLLPLGAGRCTLWMRMPSPASMPRSTASSWRRRSPAPCRPSRRCWQPSPSPRVRRGWQPPAGALRLCRIQQGSAIHIELLPLSAVPVACPPAAGLSRADPDSPSKFAEALLGREYNSKSLQQFLQHGGEVLRFYVLWDDRQAQFGDRCVAGRGRQGEAGAPGACMWSSASGGAATQGGVPGGGPCPQAPLQAALLCGGLNGEQIVSAPPPPDPLGCMAEPPTAARCAVPERTCHVPPSPPAPPCHARRRRSWKCLSPTAAAPASPPSSSAAH